MNVRILVTGLGTVSAAGLSLHDNIVVLDSGRRALSACPSFLDTVLQVPVGEVRADNAVLKERLGLPEGRTVTRTALLAALAASEAVRDAGLDRGMLSGGRTGLIVGTSMGGMDLSEEFYGEFRKDGGGDTDLIRMHDCGATTSFVADYLGMTGFRTTVSTACSSSGNAIMLGARMIRAGLLDTVVAGGADALSRFTVNGFNSLRILSSSPCRPFDVSRDGLNLGEGAGFIVLRKDSPGSVGGHEPYCILTGWSNTDEAFHQTGSSASGEGAFSAMSEAMSAAGLEPDDIDYVNAHGTATPGNDLSEGTAIGRLFGKSAVFGSFKGYIGHTLAASEGIEAAFCAISVRDGVLWPSAGFSEEDPEIGMSPMCALRRGCRLRHVVSNSFGFGGNNSSLVFSGL